MRQLLSMGKAKVNERGENGVTALLVAVEARNMELLKCLLKNGADRTLKVISSGERRDEVYVWLFSSSHDPLDAVKTSGDPP